ncbi:hypothetical protein E6O75_ATG06443 [Venturia nashicola]|uniref:Uncharacterized protein n=1 Tax=Venturia nashicola TaxID=86259 RepID=A0A4Z1NQQ1_9PEZI|nr:hypothetical protein E6O75_ATG06443 [Venturia nashicola]
MDRDRGTGGGRFASGGEFYLKLHRGIWPLFAWSEQERLGVSGAREFDRGGHVLEDIEYQLPVHNCSWSTFYHATIWSTFYQATIWSTFYQATIWSTFYQATIWSTFYQATIWSTFYQATIWSTFYQATISPRLMSCTKSPNAGGPADSSHTFGETACRLPFHLQARILSTNGRKLPVLPLALHSMASDCRNMIRTATPSLDPFFLFRSISSFIRKRPLRKVAWLIDLDLHTTRRSICLSSPLLSAPWNSNNTHSSFQFFFLTLFLTFFDIE